MLVSSYPLVKESSKVNVMVGKHPSGQNKWHFGSY